MLWSELGKKIAEKTLSGRALVRIRSKIEKNTLFGRALVSLFDLLEGVKKDNKVAKC